MKEPNEIRLEINSGLLKHGQNDAGKVKAFLQQRHPNAEIEVYLSWGEALRVHFGYPMGQYADFICSWAEVNPADLPTLLQRTIDAMLSTS